MIKLHSLLVVVLVAPVLCMMFTQSVLFKPTAVQQEKINDYIEQHTKVLSFRSAPTNIRRLLTTMMMQSGGDSNYAAFMVVSSIQQILPHQHFKVVFKAKGYKQSLVC